MRIWDDDPDKGPARYVEYEVVNVTGPSATHVITSGEGWRQRMHPSDYIRGQGQSDAADTGPRIVCHMPGCKNKASQNHKDCSSCRSRRLAKCGCGRPLSYGALRCFVCVVAERREQSAANSHLFCVCGRRRGRNYARCLTCRASNVRIKRMRLA